MLSPKAERGEPLSPHFATKEYAKKFIEEELKRNNDILEKLADRLDNGSWLLTDEIDLKVAQESIHLLNHIKSIFVHLGYYD